MPEYGLSFILQPSSRVIVLCPLTVKSQTLTAELS